MQTQELYRVDGGLQCDEATSRNMYNLLLFRVSIVLSTVSDGLSLINLLLRKVVGVSECSKVRTDATVVEEDSIIARNHVL